MKARSLWIFICVILCVANVTFLIMRRPRRQAPLPEARSNQLDALQEQRVALLVDWRKSSHTALQSQEIPSIARSITNRVCHAGRDTTSAANVTDEQKADAIAVISGLMAVYTDYTADSQLKFWSSRDVELNPVKVEGLKEILKEASQPQDLNTSSLSNEDVFREYFRLAQPKTHWHSIVLDASCVTYWSATPTPAMFERLGVEDSEVFSNLNTYHAFFQPKQQQTSVASPQSSLTTFMDVKCLVVLDSSKSDAMSPYFIRFWWDNVQLRWQPLIMTSVATDSISPPVIVF